MFYYLNNILNKNINPNLQMSLAKTNYFFKFGN